MASGVSSGIRRKVDDLGRVVIPAGIRRTLNIREGDSVEVSVDGERVVLAKPRDACVFCGREGDDLHSFRGRLLCNECVVTIGEVVSQQRATSARDDLAPLDARAEPAPASAPPTAAAIEPAPPARSPAARPDTAPPAARPDAPSPAARPDLPPTAARPPVEPTPPTPPPSWPTGPIDGDAFARDQARQLAAAARDEAASPADTEHDDAEHDDAATDRRRPPYDPASTTAW